MRSLMCFLISVHFDDAKSRSIVWNQLIIIVIIMELHWSTTTTYEITRVSVFVVYSLCRKCGNIVSVELLHKWTLCVMRVNVHRSLYFCLVMYFVLLLFFRHLHNLQRTAVLTVVRRLNDEAIIVAVFIFNWCHFYQIYNIIFI